MVLFPPVGPRGDHFSAQGFMCDMFMRRIPPEKAHQFYHHFTCATDTHNIKRVFDDVRSTVMAKYCSNVLQ